MERSTIGGNNENTNLEIVRLILKALDKLDSLIVRTRDRIGHDRRYAIDNTKITAELNWSIAYTFEQGIAETIQWYLAYRDWTERITSGECKKYYQEMYSR